MAEKIRARPDPCLSVFNLRSAPRPRALAANSHYKDPIPAGPLHGRSRAWGDAALEVQQDTVRQILSEAKSRKWSALRTAFSLGVARVESGFNPDAAAASTSAAGIGQFIDRTGAAYGLNEENRFRTASNVSAMFDYMSDCMQTVSRRYSYRSESARLADTYACYHDGPSLRFDGRSVAALEVMPWTRRFSQWLAECPAKLGLGS